ncbi:alpha/beta hydrolase [Saccharothrix coeruleofusca]|uniref:S-formylglutathione hydrolase FrmB n=1 Tax=Saccharothrix coeruleofusca TaxID=33919 RepID=A0A918EBQ7_9PSEU|nr:alpha/beta hydrolase family protein [Saccharothrix coeruleofusca]MBP2334021.1 S-formylglutathione hydrolase FrmB [Saccharothrix coeruleofusca]GGP44003.1 hypothetical protein GCM10010185_14610 [Saccharothrix coeruleofusca]
MPRKTLIALTALLVAACSSPAPGAAPVTTSATASTSSSSVVGERQVDITVPSAALGRDAEVRLLLPRRWHEQPDRTWPVLYLLTGCCGSHLSWTGSSSVAELTAEEDVLVVMPDGGPAGFYSDWRSGPGWETFHLTELPAVLERDYRASRTRAVAGFSMGGFGALSYTARHPGFFRAAASYSGVLHTTMSQQSRDLVAQIVTQAGLDPNALWQDWSAHNPYDLAERLRGTPLYISSGNGAPGPLDVEGKQPDWLEELLGRQSAAVVARLGELGIPVTADLYGPGTHVWEYWDRALRQSMPMLLDALRG